MQSSAAILSFLSHAEVRIAMMEGSAKPSIVMRRRTLFETGSAAAVMESLEAPEPPQVVTVDSVLNAHLAPASSHSGSNPDPEDPDLVQVVWAKGDATDANVVANVAHGSDAIVHAAGLLFDGESGLSSLNAYLSGSKSEADASSSYDAVIRSAALNALAALQASSRHPTPLCMLFPQPS